jgi:hypothetical protein
MRTLKPIDGEGLPAPTVAERVLKLARDVDDPTAMTRVELRNMPRPARREVDQLIKRELNGAVWSLDTFVRGEFPPPDRLNDPLDREISDVRALFGEFVDARVADNHYDERFATAFRERGMQALNGAIERVSQALAEEDR